MATQVQDTFQSGGRGAASNITSLANGTIKPLIAGLLSGGWS